VRFERLLTFFTYDTSQMYTERGVSQGVKDEIMKQGRIVVRGTLAVVASFAVAACDDSTGLDLLDDGLLLDMAIVAADATMEDLGTWGMPFGFAGPNSAKKAGGPGRPGGRHGVGGPLSGTRAKTFYDAAGVEQDSYDELLTASVRHETEVSGDVERDNWSATIYRLRDMTVSGMEGTETHRTRNGTGEEKITRNRNVDDDGTVRTSQMSGTFTYTDVVVPVPGSETRYPISGTVTRSMTGSVVNGPNGDKTRSAEVTITFNGDATATIIVNGEEREIDLTTRKGRLPLRKSRGG
jgi:hypothetical protein